MDTPADNHVTTATTGPAVPINPYRRAPHGVTPNTANRGQDPSHSSWRPPTGVPHHDQAPRRGGQGRGKPLPQPTQQLLSSMDDTSSIPITFPATITNPQRRTLPTERAGTRQRGPNGIDVKRDTYKLKSCLSDTGAISSDYISLQLVNKLVT